MKLTAPFTVDQAQAAGDAWGFNCGPAALCAIFDLTPTQLRPALCDFESKRYTNPRMMRSILDWMNARYEWHVTRDYIGTFPALWPHNSLIRVQWDGPWCGPTRPAIARQRHTHWIACRHNGTHEPQVFDVNCTCGGWIYATEWEQQVVPWLLRQCEPQATGRWWQTHRAVVAE